MDTVEPHPREGQSLMRDFMRYGRPRSPGSAKDNVPIGGDQAVTRRLGNAAQIAATEGRGIA